MNSAMPLLTLPAVLTANLAAAPEMSDRQDNVSVSVPAKKLPDNRHFGSIFNSDDGGVFTSGKDITPAEYGQAVREMLGGGMTVLAQCVGMPDPVIYRSQVATTMDIAG
jgi:hypothetical protein